MLWKTRVDKKSIECFMPKAGTRRKVINCMIVRSRENGKRLVFWHFFSDEFADMRC